MKNELDHYRKFSIADYCVNLKKFKEYVYNYYHLILITLKQLEFCRKNNIFTEKIDILESLVNLTNEKSQIGALNLTDVLNDYTNLCVLVNIL